MRTFFLSFFVSLLFCFRANLFIALYTKERIIAKALFSQLEQGRKAFLHWQRYDNACRFHDLQHESNPRRRPLGLHYNFMHV